MQLDNLHQKFPCPECGELVLLSQLDRHCISRHHRVRFAARLDIELERIESDALAIDLGGDATHQAEVSMTIELDGECVSVAQCGPDFVILREYFGRTIAPGTHAMFCIVVDGKADRQLVVLPAGVSATDARVIIASWKPPVK